ncbi:hypothetical protein DFH07DRAFT_500316 [Mycena maculata]|uniref:DUF6535 domain-containing protein n=1 Tax=Mycena maculata TaxID=230809 RepID=A0AAD7J2U4_9AGAR|nr:hypothetical protein DFH07DRAFT_500316 [Mycena maculata]
MEDDSIKSWTENVTVKSQDTVKSRDDDPSHNMWSVYMNQVEQHNKVLVECWKADMNSILIFAGLFSASVTTFIVESYQSLSPPDPDPNQATLALVLQFVLSQSDGLNSTISSSLLLPSSSPPFVPPTSALICNTLWFLSLAFSLACALAATLVDQWARNYILATESRPALHKRARISAYLHIGLQKFQMNTVVEAIPTLLHISLLLFFAGLVEFLRPVSPAISNLMLGMLLFCGSLYFLVTFLPIFHSDCPYETPLSGPWWHFLRALGVVGRRDYGGARILTFTSMAEAREADATEITQARDERDFHAMHWTLSMLREEWELEPFLGFIPQLVSGFDYSAKLLLHRLLNHGDPTIGLRYRIPRLLGFCAEGNSNPTVAHSRSTACLHAIWSLTMMAVPLSVPFTFSSREKLAFDEETLDHIEATKAQIPSVADCADSTAAVVARSLLDMFVDMATAMEDDLSSFLRSGRCRNSRMVSVRDPEWAAMRSPLATKKAKQQLLAIEQLLSTSVKATTPLLHKTVETSRQYLDDLVEVVVSYGDSTQGRALAAEALEYVKTFQQLLNDVGLSLTLDYISTLVRSPSLPHEAFNTLRRLFIKINFDMCRAPTHAQSQLVGCLDEALEQNPIRRTRLPASILNILLGLSGSALDDPGCAMKARGIISHYLTILPSPALTRDEALKAISHLEGALPVDARSPPVSELLSSHMYANTKLERKRTDPSWSIPPELNLEASLYRVG